MKRFVPILLLTFLVSLSLACKTAARVIFGQTPTPVPSATPLPTHTPIPTLTATFTATAKACPDGECIVACVNRLGAIVDPQRKATPRHKLTGEDEHTLVTYEIDGDQIIHPTLEAVSESLKGYQADKLPHMQTWDYFAAIIPLEQRSFLAHYQVFTDGEDNTLAAVVQSDDSPALWDLSVDILDTGDPKELTFTLIHEFGHLLTLNPEQVPPSQAIFDQPESDSVYDKEAQACPNYFPGEGCSREDSYINLFIERFWDNIYDEWLDIDAIEDEDDYEDSLDEFYEQYEDQFVTDYAPTSPEEDIAESWSYFVLKPKPDNQTVADQKVLFFYEFPELVELRAQIARNLCEQLEK